MGLWLAVLVTTLSWLDQVSSWYTLVIFTASMQEYADPVIDWLDAGRGYFAKRLYREVCRGYFLLDHDA